MSLPFKSTLHPRVFWGSTLIVLVFLLIGIIFPEDAARIFEQLQDWVILSFGWFYILAVALFFFAVVYLALSRYGNLKLGPDDSEPDYPYLTWMAMLFAAGMGIGLMFFAVAEPLQHFSAPPAGPAGTVEAARQAQVITFFHWGVHAWAVYAVVGLSLAYFCFRYNLPLTIRSGLYPLFGKRIEGWIGDSVDIFAVCGTLFGIATSMGLGVLQINAGLEHLFGWPQETWLQIVLIIVVTSLATLSVVSGLDVGIRRLSELNLLVAIALMLFVLSVGPTAFLMNAFVQNIGGYLDNFFARSFSTQAFREQDWMKAWTLFYWAWWIAWSPFVGMFIARISRGRTVREFVLGVLLVPTVFTFFWMTVFGNTAIFLDMTAAAGQLARDAAANASVALFEFLEYLPWSGVTSTLAVLLVAIFFVTSADSGSLVIDTLAAGGVEDAPVWQRIYWCALEGTAAALLLLAGGLTALQTVTLVSALPFAIIMFLLILGLYKGMKADMSRLRRHGPAAGPAPGSEVSWRRRLSTILHSPTRQDARRFLDEVAAPALRAVADELGKRGLNVSLEDGQEGQAQLTIEAEGQRNFVYGVQMQARRVASFTAAAAKNEQTRPHEWQVRTVFADGSRGYDLMGLSSSQVINDILNQFERYQALVTSEATALYARSPDPL
ncbi:BCCT family transporter [Alcaligenes sp. Marseille-Q7550]